MFRRLENFLGCGIAVLWVCFPTFAQAPFANAGKMPTYDFKLRAFPPAAPEPGCFCDAQCMKQAAKPFNPLSNRFSVWRPPSDIQAIDLEGLKKIIQRDPKDPRPLLINFWATWCDGCREEFPELVKIDNDFRSRGLNFLSITVDEVEDKGLAAQFLKEMKAMMPVVLLNVPDKDIAIHTVDATWGGELPATFLYDKDGKVVFKYFGKIKPLELRAAIDKELNRKQ